MRRQARTQCSRFQFVRELVRYIFWYSYWIKQSIGFTTIDNDNMIRHVIKAIEKVIRFYIIIKCDGDDLHFFK